MGEIPEAVSAQEAFEAQSIPSGQTTPESASSFKERFIQEVRQNPNADERYTRKLLDLPKEEIKSLSTQDYIDYLHFLDRTAFTDLAVKNFDVIVDRFGEDIREYSKRDYPDRELAMTVGQATRNVLFMMNGSEEKPNPDVVKKMYAFMNDPDRILSFQAAESVDQLVWLDSTRALYGQYLEDVSDRLATIEDKNPTVTETLVDVAWGSFGQESMQEIMNRSLNKAGTDQAVDRVLTAFSNRLGLERTMANFRQLAAGDPNLGPKLETAVKTTFREEGNVYEDLRDLYENIHFESYQINEEVNRSELDLLTAKIPKGTRVLDIGAGTGRLMEGLKNRGREVVGFDFTARHSQYIKENDPRSRVLIADWLNMPFKDGSFEAAYCLGRSFTHNTTNEERRSFFHEARRVLGEDGILIIDIPNPDKGYYLENRQKLAQKLEERGIDYFEGGLIFDSPDGENYFARLAPLPDQFEDLARLSGFQVEDRITKELPTGEEDENFYYVLRKTDRRLGPQETLDLVAKTMTSGPSLRVEYF